MVERDAVRIYDAGSGVLRRRFRLSGTIQVAVATMTMDALVLLVSQEEERFDPGLAGPYFLRQQLPVWLDLTSGRLRTLPETAVRVPKFLALSPTSEYMAIAPADGAIEVWSLNSGDLVGRVPLALPLDEVTFSTDGRRLKARASGNPNPTAELSDRTPWEEQTGSWELPSLKEYRESRALSESSIPEPAGDALAGLGALVPEDFPWRGSSCLAVDPRGGWLALETHLLDLTSGTFQALGPPARAYAEVLSVGFSGRRASLLRGFRDGTVEELPYDGDGPGVEHNLAPRSEAVAFSVEAATLAIQSSNEPAPRLVCLPEIDGKTLPAGGKAKCLAFSPDGSVLAGVGWRGQLSIWSVESQELCLTRVGGPHNPRALAWSPDGGELGILGESVRRRAVVQVLTPESGSLEDLEIFEGGRPLCLAWSPDGQVLFAGGDDGFIYGWDRRECCGLKPVVGDPSSLVGLVVGAEETSLYASHRDGGVLEWGLEALLERMGRAG